MKKVLLAIAVFLGGVVCMSTASAVEPWPGTCAGFIPPPPPGVNLGDLGNEAVANAKQGLEYVPFNGYQFSALQVEGDRPFVFIRVGTTGGITDIYSSPAWQPAQIQGGMVVAGPVNLNASNFEIVQVIAFIANNSDPVAYPGGWREVNPEFLAYNCTGSTVPFPGS